LVVYRASRLEALLQPLSVLLAAAPPDHLLAPAQLIAAHPGMRRWLLNRLAELAGPRGIAANIDIDLPGQWIDKLSARWQPTLAAALPAYATDALRWRLFALFEALLEERIAAPQLRAYLGQDVPGARRWQLASVLAELFGRLLVYRPDWLQAWAGGRTPIDDAGELPALWRALRQAIGQPHRSEQHAALCQVVAQAKSSQPPLHVFGLSHLPPRHLELLRALSRQRLVVMYCADPCIEHWAGLGSRRDQLRRLLDAAPGSDAQSLHLDSGHPLLASLGRLGQQFGAQLEAAADDIAIEVRHSLDAEPDDHARRCLLGRLQESIRRLDPGLVAQCPADALAPAADASLRVHRCHGRWRELEVLRDALLGARLDLPDLQCSQIAVLAPSMADYLPLLGAVFGAPGDPDSPLPYHVADLPLGRTHPLHQALLGLVRLAMRRSTAPELMALLRLEAVRRALELDLSDLETLQYGLGKAAAAFALDAESRAEEGLPALPEHTLAWGLDRLCLGYVFGDEEDDPVLLDDLRPAGALGETDAQALGGLFRLLAAIKRLRRQGAAPRPASRWIDMFESLWRALFRIDRLRSEEVEAEDALLDCLAAIRRSIDDAAVDPAMNYAQALAMLDDRLAELGGQARYLHGGITFCGMVPQRALPYRMIAVLGLNDGDFPRRARPLQLDPLPRHPRIGDRDVASDDRYLFLETLMSARDRLHLSWVGEDPQDGSPREPSPVLSELMDALGRDGRSADQPWLIEHPLQPFDARYLRDPGATDALRSFGPLWRPASVTAPAHADPVAADTADVVAIESLRAWLRNPARELLRQRWRMPLRGLDHATLAAEEPLDSHLDARDPLWRELLAVALQSGMAPPESPGPLLLGSGRLPPGRPGQLAYARQREIAAALHRAAAALPPFASGAPRLALPLSIELPGIRLEGDSGPLYRCADTFWLLEWVDHARRFKRLATRLDLLLRQAAAALSLPPGSALQVVRLAPDTEDAWATQLSLDPRQLAKARPELLDVLATVTECWRQSQAQPLAYFPEASAALFESRDVEEIWDGRSHQVGERDWSPGYAWLLAGEQRFWEPEDPAYARFHDTAQRLFALLGRFDPAATAAPGP
jgi:exodeoxyribonuclease V gamma subunit